MPRYKRDTLQDDIEELRQPMRPDVEDERVRLRSGDSAIDPFNIPMDVVKSFMDDYGLSLEWKRYEVFGQQNYAYMRSLEQQGWRPLPGNHPLIDGMFGPKGDSGPVIVEGNILMERPMRLTREAREEERRKAGHQISLGHQKMRESPEGQAPRMAPQIKTSREAMTIPD